MLQYVLPDPGSSLFSICSALFKIFERNFYRIIFFIFPQLPGTFGGILLCIMEVRPFGM